MAFTQRRTYGEIKKSKEKGTQNKNINAKTTYGEIKERERYGGSSNFDTQMTIDDYERWYRNYGSTGSGLQTVNPITLTRGEILSNYKEKLAQKQKERESKKEELEGNLPVFKKDLQTAQSEYDEIDGKYWDLKEQMSPEEFDKLDKRYKELYSTISGLKGKISETEGQIRRTDKEYELGQKYLEYMSDPEKQEAIFNQEYAKSKDPIVRINPVAEGKKGGWLQPASDEYLHEMSLDTAAENIQSIFGKGGLIDQGAYKDTGNMELYGKDDLQKAVYQTEKEKRFYSDRAYSLEKQIAEIEEEYGPIWDLLAQSDPEKWKEKQAEYQGLREELNTIRLKQRNASGQREKAGNLYDLKTNYGTIMGEDADNATSLQQEISDLETEYQKAVEYAESLHPEKQTEEYYAAWDQADSIERRMNEKKEKLAEINKYGTESETDSAFHEEWDKGEDVFSMQELESGVQNASIDRIYSFINHGREFSTWGGDNGYTPISGEYSGAMTMLPEEIDRFNKLYNTAMAEGLEPTEAKAFFEALQPYLNQRYRMYEELQHQHAAKTIPILSSVGSALGTVAEPFMALRTMYGKATNQPWAKDWNSRNFALSRMQTDIENQIAKDLGPVGGIVYKGGMGAIKNAIRGFESMGFGAAAPAVNLGLFFGENYYNSYQQKLKDTGGNDDAASLYALVDSGIATLFEVVSVEAMFSDSKNVWEAWIKNVVAEASEEFNEGVVGPYLHELLDGSNEWKDRAAEILSNHGYEDANGNWIEVKDEKEAWKQACREWNSSLFEAMITAGISAGGSTAVSIANNAVRQTRTGAKISDVNNTFEGKSGRERLMEAAAGIKDSESQKMAEDIKENEKNGKKTSNYKIGKLATTMMEEADEHYRQTVLETMERDVRSQMEEAGVPADIAKDAAAAVAKGMRGEKLSPADIKAIAKDKRAIEVWTSFNSDPEKVAAVAKDIKEATEPQRSVADLIGDLTGRTAKGTGALAKDIDAANRESDSKEAAVDNLQGRIRGILSERYAAAAKTLLQTTTTLQKSKTFLDDIMKIRLAAYGLRTVMPKTNLDSQSAQTLWNEAKAEFADEEKNRVVRQATVTPGEGTATYNGASYGTGGWTQAVNGDKTLTGRQKLYMHTVAEIAKRMGMAVNFINEAGVKSGVNMEDVYGSEDQATGAVTVNIAGLDNNRMTHNAVVTVAHEFTHWLEQNSRNGYAALRQFVFDELRLQGTDVETELIRSINIQDTVLGAESGESLDLYGAVAEVVARASEGLFTSAEMRNRLAEQDEGLYNKVKNFVRQFVARLNAAIKGIDSSLSREARTLKAKVDEIAKLWLEGYEEALGRGEEGAEATEGERFSIKQLPTGENYVDVDTDQNQFNGLKPKEILRKAQSIIKERFVGKTLQYDGGRAVVDAKTAGEYAYPSVRQMKESVKRAKGRASTELDNLVKIGTVLNPNDPDYPNASFRHKQGENTLGYKYYKTLFRVNGRWFTGIVNIEQKVTPDKKTRFDRIIDITQIKEDTSRNVVAGNSPTAAEKAVGAASANGRIAQNENNGKSISSAQRDQKALRNDINESDGTETHYGDHERFSVRVTDQKELDFLNNQETVKTYKSMQLIDGKLYPPMAAVVAGGMEDYSVLGQWEKATEHPELIKKGNKFTLNKGKGKGSLDAAYNPYMHSSNLMINDQFSGAYNRPNLVTVECEVPVSELTSGYHAEFAKDSTGWHAWHTGPVAGQLRKQKGQERQVMLSRWIKPMRIVSDAEVAQHYAELLKGTEIAVPDNVVTPSLKDELIKAGVKVSESGKVSYSIAQRDRDYMDAVTSGDMETAQQMVEEAAERTMPDSKMRTPDGKLRKLYHGTWSDTFYEFDPDLIGKAREGDVGFFGKGFYFAYSKGEARYYGGNVMDVYLNITNPFNYVEQLHTLDGKRTNDYNASRAVFVTNYAEKFPELSDKHTVRVVEKGKDEYRKISLKEFAEKYRDIVKNKKFTVEKQETYEGTVWRALADKREESYTNESGETYTWIEYEYQKTFYSEEDAKNQLTNAYYYLENNVYDAISIQNPTIIIQETEFSNSVRERGYDGVIQSEDGDEAVAFDSSQIKLADPVTRDDNGNIIPLSERFNQESKDIRYSIAQRDQEYMDAVNSDNMETAQRMVDEQAEEMFSGSKVRGANGKLLKVYHGTQADFTVFDTSISGGKNGTQEGFGIYLSDEQKITKQYGDRQIGAYLNMQKPAYGFKKTLKKAELVKLIRQTCENEAKQMLAEDDSYKYEDALRDTWVSNWVFTHDYPSMQAVYSDVAQQILNNNDSDADMVYEIMESMGIRSYDRAMDFYHDTLTPVTGIDGFWQKWDNHETGGKSNVFVAFDSAQIKEADPATYDDNGNVIPLSQRFNQDNKDIRWSVSQREQVYKSLNIAEEEANETLAKSGEIAYEPARYSFAGFNAAGVYGSDARRARQMAAKGATEEEIREATGSIKGYNGRWWRILDNNDMHLKYGLDMFKEGDPYLLPSIYDAEELYKAYPQLRKAWVYFKKTEEDYFGATSPSDMRITINTRFERSMEDVEATLQHEIQHLIQYLEGSNSGASVTYWEDMQKIARARLANNDREIARIYEKYGIDESQEFAFGIEFNPDGTVMEDWLFPEELEKVRKMSDEDLYMYKRVSYDNRKWSRIVNGVGPGSLYFDTVGEVEARAASEKTGPETKIRYPDGAVTTEEYSAMTRFSVRQQDMEVSRFMLGLNENNMTTAQEKTMVRQFKELDAALRIERHALNDRTRRLRELEAKQNPTAFDREEMRKLRNRIEINNKKIDRLESQMIKATSEEGYARLMYQQEQNMRNTVSGRTSEEVRATIEALTKQVAAVTKEIETRQKDIDSMRDDLTFRKTSALVDSSAAEKVAAMIRKMYNSRINKQDLIRAMTEIRLKIAAGKNIDAEAEELAWKVLSDATMDGGESLKRLRGTVIKLGKGQVKELLGSNSSLKELRSIFAGSGIQVRSAKDGEVGLDGGSWEELCNIAPELDRNAAELEQVNELIRFVQNQKQQMSGAEQYRDNIDEVVMDLKGWIASIGVNTPQDPGAMKILDSMNKLINEMATGIAGSAEKLNAVKAQLADLVDQGKLAISMTDKMQREVEQAIRYNNTLAEQSEAALWKSEKWKLIEQLKSENTQNLLKEQEKWKEKIAKDKQARQMMQSNQQLRKMIHTNVTRVARLIFNETDVKNMPEHMKGLAREMLEMIMRNDVNGRKITGINRKDLLDNLRTLDIIRKQDGGLDLKDIEQIHDEEAQDMVLDALADIEDGIKYYNASTGKDIISNLQAFHNALDRIAEAVVTITNVIHAEQSINLGDRRVAITDAANEIIYDMRRSRFKGEMRGRGSKAINAVQGSVISGNTTPVYFFKNLLNRGMMKQWAEMKRGQNRNGLETQKAADFMQDLANRTNYKAWADQKHTVTIGNRKLELTIGNIMEIYAIWKREQISKENYPEMSSHMEVGGIFIDEDTRTEGKLHREKQNLKAMRVNKADVDNMYGLLTAEQKQYLDEVVGYLSNQMSDLGNEASMRMYGIKKYKESWYFPMRVWDGVKSARSDKGIHGRTENRAAGKGWQKRRINNASNALVIGDFTTDAVNHIVEMINYNTMAPAIENFNKILNFQTKEIDETGVQEGDEYYVDVETPIVKRNLRIMFEEAYGKQALNYLETFLKDLNGGMIQDQRSTLRDRMISVFRKNAVAGSLSVALQQPLSYIRAAMMISPKHLAQAISPTYWKGSHAEMNKYSGVAVIKDMGRFDMNFGQSAKDYISPDTKVGKYEWVSDKLTILPELMDRMTWTRMWSAVKLEQHELHPEMDMKSDAFLNMVAERFNDVMMATQVYDSVLVKSQNMRSNKVSMKMLTSFMAEPTLTLNVLSDAVLNVKEKGGKAMLAKAGATFALGAVLQALMKGLMGSGRTPDEKKTWWENFLNKWAQNFIGEINPMGLIPGYSDLIELLKKGELSDDAMGVIGKFKTAVDTTRNAISGNGKGVYRDIEDSAAQIAQLFTDIPYKNIMRDMRAMYNWFSGSSYAKRDTSGAVIKYQTEAAALTADNMLGVLNTWLGDAGFKTTNKAYYGRMFDAVKNGNQAEAEGIREYLKLAKGIEEKDINGGVKAAAKDRLKAGQISETEYQKYMKKVDPSFKEEDLFWDTDRIKYQEETGKKVESNEKYYRLWDAMDGNKANDIGTAITLLMKHGVEAKSIKSAITSQYKAAYLAADSAGKTKIRDAIQKAYRKMGLTAEDANKVIDGWVKDSKKK